MAEKELLQDTLTGAVRVLSEVLSLVNPAAFGRAVRVQRYIRQIAETLPLPNLWELEIAGLMSQLGCVTLHPDTIDAVYAGRPLDPDEQARYEAHPSVARDLLARIPRMERIAWMIACQNDTALPPDFAQDDSTRFGAELLQVLVVFDEALSAANGRREALDKLKARFPNLDGSVRQCLEEIGLEMEAATIRTCSLDHLAAGMVAEQEVRTPSGLLVVARGQTVTGMLILKLKNLRQRGVVPATMVVAVPPAV